MAALIMLARARFCACGTQLVCDTGTLCCPKPWLHRHGGAS